MKEKFIGIGILVLVAALLVGGVYVLTLRDSPPAKAATVYTESQACVKLAAVVKQQFPSITIVTARCIRVKPDGSAEDKTGKSNVYIAALLVSNGAAQECDLLAFRARLGKAVKVLQGQKVANDGTYCTSG